MNAEVPRSDRADWVDYFLSEIAQEVIIYLEQNEHRYPGRWVPAWEIKEALGLSRESYPLSSPTQGKTGWLLLILTRQLEEEGLVEYQKVGNRSLYRLK